MPARAELRLIEADRRLRPQGYDPPLRILIGDDLIRGVRLTARTVDFYGNRQS